MERIAPWVLSVKMTDGTVVWESSYFCTDLHHAEEMSSMFRRRLDPTIAIVSAYIAQNPIRLDIRRI